MLLGSGELGKEFTIAAKRLGLEVIAVDSYDNAPAQQVSDKREVINMLDGDQLDAIVDRHDPDIIVPEIEAIRTERLYDYERRGIQVVPSARAVNFTMNRKAIRDLAAVELGLRTANFRYASSPGQFREAVNEIGIPCVVKPLMSSSGKGQSTVRSADDIENAWLQASLKGRGAAGEVIVEEFISFQSEITLLTLTQKNGNTLFCPPIGHRQERGDYQESWQPCSMNTDQIEKAQEIASKITNALTGAGIWGVEFFLTEDDVVFSELSPRPHDTGMVTLGNTQNFNEFELHLRAVLGLPVNEIRFQRSGASAVILSDDEIESDPEYSGIEEALHITNSDIRIFGKPNAGKYRRMGVALTWGEKVSDIDGLRSRAQKIASMVKVR